MEQQYTSERLILETMRVSDAPFILELVNTPGWLKFIGDRNVSNTADAVKYISAIQSNSDTCFWVVFHKTTKMPLGVVSLIQRSYLPDPDIGFAFLPQHGNQGYAFEAVNCIFQNIIRSGAQKIVLATTLIANNNSRKLLEKLGLVYVKNIAVEAEDLMLYSTDSTQTKIDLSI